MKTNLNRFIHRSVPTILSLAAIQPLGAQTASSVDWGTWSGLPASPSRVYSSTHTSSMGSILATSGTANGSTGGFAAQLNAHSYPTLFPASPDVFPLFISMSGTNAGIAGTILTLDFTGYTINANTVLGFHNLSSDPDLKGYYQLQAFDALGSPVSLAGVSLFGREIEDGNTNGSNPLRLDTSTGLFDLTDPIIPGDPPSSNSDTGFYTGWNPAIKTLVLSDTNPLTSGDSLNFYVGSIMVPEPSAALLAVAGGLGFAMRRRRR